MKFVSILCLTLIANSAWGQSWRDRVGQASQSLSKAKVSVNSACAPAFAGRNAASEQILSLYEDLVSNLESADYLLGDADAAPIGSANVGRNINQACSKIRDAADDLRVMKQLSRMARIDRTLLTDAEDDLRSSAQLLRCRR